MIFGVDCADVESGQGDAIGMPGFASTVDLNRFNVMLEGANGTRVAWVQRKLGAAATGAFDAALTQQLIAFQKANGLVGDGIVGPKTFARLCWAAP